MNFSLEQLSAFVNAAEQGSFSAAARKLGKAQSVVSTLVANMEVDVGVDLFSREGRYPRLTVAGEALLTRAKMILSQCERLSASAESISLGVEPRLCIAIESLAAPDNLSQLILPLDKEYPDVSLDILLSSSGDIPELVRTGRAQLGIMIQPEQAPDALDFKLLGNIEFWCVAAEKHRLIRARQITYDELALHRQVIVTPRNRAEKLHWQISSQVWATDNPGMALAMVKAGIGWAVLPSLLAKPAISSGKVKRLNLDFDTDSWTAPIDLVWSTKTARGPVSLAVENILQPAMIKPA